MTTQIGSQFRSLCKEWRRRRSLSQLDLALAAEVSQRHVSWLETGRSAPSRDMVLRLAEAMQMPLRERNVFLEAAGYARIYRERALSEPAMAPVHDALNRVLAHHDPLPAIVVDRFWNVKQTNQAAAALLSALAFLDEGIAASQTADGLNLAAFTLHPQGLRCVVSNWQDALPLFVQRLRSEARASGDAQITARYEDYIALASDVPRNETVTLDLLPVLPLEFDIRGLRLSLFSVISTFGTPQDITTDELRIEAFYPMDDSTKAFFADR